MQEYVASKGLSSGPPPAQWQGMITKAGKPDRKLDMGHPVVPQTGSPSSSAEPPDSSAPSQALSPHIQAMSLKEAEKNLLSKELSGANKELERTRQEAQHQQAQAEVRPADDSSQAKVRQLPGPVGPSKSWQNPQNILVLSAPRSIPPSLCLPESYVPLASKFPAERNYDLKGRNSPVIMALYGLAPACAGCGHWDSSGLVLPGLDQD